MTVIFEPVDQDRMCAQARDMYAVGGRSTTPRRPSVRWVPAISSVLVAICFGLGNVGPAAADELPTETVTAEPTPPPAATTLAPTATATTTPSPSTTQPQLSIDDNSPLMMCPGANGWRSGPEGQGIVVTLYEYGPANVVVSVNAVSGNDTSTVSVDPGQSALSVSFPTIAASAVRSVTVRSDGPGPLPPQCILGRSDR